MSDVRKNLKELLKSKGFKEAWLSERLGYQRTYINDLLRGKAKWPPELRTAWAIHELTGLPTAALGMSESDVKRMRRSRFDPKGLSDDVEPYEPPRGAPLKPLPGMAYYRLKTNVLELQPRSPVVGDILVVDESDDAEERLQPGQIVLLRIPLDAADTSYRLLLREFARPGQFFTNRRSDGEIFFIGDAKFVARPRVLGVVINIHRDLTRS